MPEERYLVMTMRLPEWCDPRSTAFPGEMAALMGTVLANVAAAQLMGNFLGDQAMCLFGADGRHNAIVEVETRSRVEARMAAEADVRARRQTPAPN